MQVTISGLTRRPLSCPLLYNSLVGNLSPILPGLSTSGQWPARCFPGVVGGSEVTEVVVTGDSRASGLLSKAIQGTCIICHRASWK